MNSTGNDLLQAIIDDPASDERRLIYADWLEESGESERAEFVRVQCELAKYTPERSGGLMRWGSDEAAADAMQSENPTVERLRRRERELLPNQRERFKSALTANMPLPSAAGTKLLFLLESAVFRRGFVDEVRCRLVDWMQHGPAIVACQPVTRVVVTDRVPEQVSSGGFRWWLDSEPESASFPEWLFGWVHAGKTGGYTWPTHQAAIDALSTACVRWAKNNHRMRT